MCNDDTIMARYLFLSAERYVLIRINILLDWHRHFRITYKHGYCCLERIIFLVITGGRINPGNAPAEPIYQNGAELQNELPREIQFSELSDSGVVGRLWLVTYNHEALGYNNGTELDWPSLPRAVSHRSYLSFRIKLASRKRGLNETLIAAGSTSGNGPGIVGYHYRLCFNLNSN